ncbi:Peptide chain release factor 1-like, mitochondrial [Orchesella cincta]|uniref:Peptide chain release factor 1-like, mitochondrial n=1 Tax=Orchesella cincta TaxID=48709 RepID=A0A1D2M809_ORCCI|nr:Peptide chain release factor 1-like, mitochondrial [Orchesella cincta]
MEAANHVPEQPLQLKRKHTGALIIKLLINCRNKAMMHTLLWCLRRLPYAPNPLIHARHKYDLSHPSVQKYLTSRTHDNEVSQLVRSIIAKQTEIKELEILAKDNPELRDVADSDVKTILEVVAQLEHEPERLDACEDVILEVSAGVGGQEAMLFTSELFRMYENYAHYKGWEMDTTNVDTTELGGVRKASMNITGPQAYRMLKFEGGVHRVQRVPKTEKSGRIHTSTSTVAVLPSPSNIDVEIQDKDLKIETKRASGAGGQHVNKTESAIRITHLPTNTVVECQIDRSQIKNRSIAMKTLRARLFERETSAQNASIRSNRKLQVGSAGRSEKIRTYNYPQDRVTDHRISFSVNLHSILNGAEGLDDVVNKLLQFSMEEALQEIFQ